MQDNHPPDPAAPFPRKPNESWPASREQEQLRESIQQLFEGRELSLPVLPSSLAQLIAACGTELPDMDEVSKQVSLDQSLCAHVLRLANSASFSPVSEIRSIPEAVRRLGTRVIADLAISSMLQESLCRGNCSGIREHLRHAAVAGVYSYRIGRLVGEGSNASLLPGLLHDVGKPMAASLLGELKDLPGGELAEEVVEFLSDDLHVLVGLRLVEDWRLPNCVATAIRFHEQPSLAPKGTHEAHIAHLASILATWTLAPDETEGIVLPELQVVRELGLSHQQLSSLFGCLEEAREAASAF